MGMFAELTIVVGTCILYGLFAPALGTGGSGSYLGEAASTAVFAFLWTFGSFFTQMLVAGNTAGLVGWVVLKQLAKRGIHTSPPPPAAADTTPGSPPSAPAP